MSATEELLKCFCHDLCLDSEPNNGTCFTSKDGYCFASVEEIYIESDDTYVIENKWGCLPADELGLLQCKTRLTNHHIPRSIICCKNEDFCNLHLYPTFERTITQKQTSFIVLAILAVILVAIIIFLCNLRKWIKLIHKCEKVYNKQLNNFIFLDRNFRPNQLVKLEESISSSKTISGELLFRYRTLSDQIEFIDKIGSGSFGGQVWICNLRGQTYACRIYNSLNQSLWIQEVQIQRQLTNPEIVGLIATDITTDPITNNTVFLLITDYFSNGSLYQFLRDREIEESAMLSLMYSIACGLHYLHAEILGNPNKPSIVHYNLKSSNIMVADDGLNCLISDFSSAHAYYNETSERPLFFASNYHNPESLRYLAPELLISSLPPSNVKNAKACDVYSIALVLWEIASRCILPETHEPANGHRYHLPYEEELRGQMPCHQTMYQLVSVNKKRPTINNKWTTSSTLVKIGKLLNESWHPLPLSRLTVLRIMKDLENLRENLEPKKAKELILSP